MTTYLNFAIKSFCPAYITRQTAYILYILGFCFAGSTNIHAQTSKLVLNGITISTGFTLNWSETVLNLSASSTIILGPEIHTVTFAASDEVVWTGDTLTITGWTGTAGSSGTSGKIIVGTDTTGLTSDQLAKINFIGYEGTATILNNGEIVPQSGSTESVISNGTGSTSICAGSIANIKVTITGGTSPYSVIYSNGSSNFTVNIYISGSDIPVSPTTNTTYTLISVTDSNNIPGTGNSGSATITVTNSIVPETVGTYTATLHHTDGATLNYIDASCNLLLTIGDAPGGNVPDSTKVRGEVLSSVPSSTTTGYFYAPRYYIISPLANGPAVVTLYFLQSDFDSYNTGNSYQIDMPLSGSNADPNITNIKLAHIVGSLSSGTITSYTPSVNWNSDTGVWEVTVDVTDAEGSYYLYTSFNCSININYSSLQTDNITVQSATVRWTHVVGALDYRIRIRPQGSVIWNTTTNTGNSKEFFGLQPNTTYEVQVRVRCSESEQGEYSNTLTFQTLPSLCVPPTGLTANLITTHSVKLDWNVVSGGISYFIQVRQVGNNWGGGSTVFTNTKNQTGLQPNTNYEARVYTNCSGTPSSGFSPSLFFSTLASSCPPPGGLTSGSITNTSANVTWNPVGFGISYFIQLRKTGTNWGGGSTISGTSKTYTGLTPGTEYETRVYTNCNGTPSSVFSTSHFFTTTGIICIQPTSLLASNITTNSVLLHWSNTGATSYSVRVRIAGANWGGNSGAPTNSKMVTGLTPATNYEFQVIGFCPGVASPWSVIGTFTTLTPGMNEDIVLGNHIDRNTFSIFPNPTTDMLNLNFEAPQDSMVMLRVIDVAGRIINEIQHMTSSGYNTVQLSLANMQNGFYMIHVYTSNGLIYTGRVIKIE